MVDRGSSSGNVWFPVVSILVVYVLSSMLFGMLFGWLGQGGEDPMFWGFVSYVAGFGAAIGYAVALKPAWGLEVPSFRPEKWGADPRVIVGGMILMLATGIVLSPVLERLPAEYFDRLDDYMKGGFWPMFTAVAVAPVVEEFLFRGIIQKNLVRRLGPFGGIAVGALLFGAVHVNPPQVVYASCLGLILGTVYYLSGSLNSAVTVHFVNNGLTSLLYMLFGTSVGLEWRILGAGTAWGWAYGLSVVLLGLGAWYAVWQIRRREAEKKMRSEN
jgi:hypothetical protein